MYGTKCLLLGGLLLAAFTLLGCPDDDEPVVDAGPLATQDVADDVPPAPPDAGPVEDADASGIPEGYTEAREPCADRNPLRNVYWGDTHVHTTLSFDAWAYENRLDPNDAYRFGRGETLKLAPLGPDGEGTREVALDRPLDFVAVTDHAEYLAEVRACTTEGNAAYDSELCTQYRVGGEGSYVTFGFAMSLPEPFRDPTICGPTKVDCPTLSDGVWEEIKEAAETHYDRTSACSFTTFVAYEYSASPDISNLHRNVIFRNANVPRPITTFEANTPQKLWAGLRATCLDADIGCDVLAIPHNSNWSNGRLFVVDYPGADSLEEERLQAEERVQLEPLVEIFQHKGDSECSNGFAATLGAPDELCDFEKLVRADDLDDCGDETGAGAMAGLGCTHRLDFVREVLKEGLKEHLRIGANPYRLGIIAATDTHGSIPGSVAEEKFVGHLGNYDDTAIEQLEPPDLIPGGNRQGPGGLAGVWAHENSRDSLFEAMRRREVFGTSGPRMVVRFFGGWEYADGLCDDPALVETGYELGVPMGGDLSAPPAGAAAPRFVTYALRDPKEGATPLQRVQIIKGWVDAAGESQEHVYDVVGDAANGAAVDPDTCQRSGPGADSLCSVWTDPDFDPGQPAFYYARVVENPSCRWSGWACVGLPEAERPPGCSDGSIDRVIQERAWTSPIWYTP